MVKISVEADGTEVGMAEIPEIPTWVTILAIAGIAIAIISVGLAVRRR